MKNSVYSIYDSLAEVFNKPFTSINNATAEREFRASVKDQHHKDDLVLYHLGDFNDANGQLIPKDPQRIIGGIEIKADIQDMPDNLKMQSM